MPVSHRLPRVRRPTARSAGSPSRGNSGLAAGGALGALLVGSAGTAGLRSVVVANAASYAIAALLPATWRPAHEAEAESARLKAKAAGKAPATGGYRTVLRDRRYLLLVGINTNFVFTSLVLSLLLMINCFQVALTQTDGTWRSTNCPTPSARRSVRPCSPCC